MKIKNYKPQILNRSTFNRLESALYYLLILFLPTQLGKHFWPDFSSVLGVRIDYLSPTIFFTDSLIFLLFVFWAIRILNVKHEKKSKIKNQKSKTQFKIQNHTTSFVFVILFLVINIVISGRILGGLYSWVKFLEMSFVAYYSAKFIGEKRHIRKVIAIFGASVIFESLLAMFQFLTLGSVGGILYFLGERSFNPSTPGIANASLNGDLVLRPYGTFPHPNVLAGFLVVSMVLILFSQQSIKHKKVLRIKYLILRSIPLTALALGTIALFLTMSRVALLLWILILVFIITAKAGIIWSWLPASPRASTGRGKSGMAGVAGIAICITAIAVFLFSPLGLRFTKLNMNDEAIVQREVLVETSIKMIKASPLFGVGMGNFIPSLSKFQEPFSSALYLQPVHNIFLLVASETGIIGLGIFLWLLWKTFQRIRNHEPRIRECLLIALSVILITGMFDHYWLTLQQGQLLFALIIGICWGNRWTT